MTETLWLTLWAFVVEHHEVNPLSVLKSLWKERQHCRYSAGGGPPRSSCEATPEQGQA